MTTVAARPKPLVEVFTIRLDEELLESIEREAQRREREAGVPVSRAALVRILIRTGLAAMKGES